MEKNILVAMVEPVGGHGGMNLYDASLCRGLILAGVRVSLYTCDETVDPDIPGLRFCPVFKAIFGKRPQWIRAIRYMIASFNVAWSAALRREKIVHFHVYQGEAAELALILVMKLFLRKLVLTVHDVESLGKPAAFGRALIGKVYDLAERLIAHNETSKRELIERLGIASSKISVIPHGNYLDTICSPPSSTDARQTLGIAETAKVMLFFGQIKAVKGLDLLVSALPAVAREVPEVQLVIAGRPWKTDFSDYDSLIDQMDIRDRCIIHLQYIPDEQVGQYYAATDLVVLPYRRIYQSGVVLLAMSHGKAVVVSDLEGMKEIITDRENGYAFSQGSTEALSRALVSALRNDSEREEIGRRALAHVRRSHDWNQIGVLTAQLYRNLL